MENRAFEEMLKPAKERLRGRRAAGIAQNTGIAFSEETKEFHFISLGREITVSYPSWEVSPACGDWYVLTLLHYMDVSDGSSLEERFMNFGAQRDGLIRGGGFDRQCEATIRNVIGKREPQEIRKACEEMGAEFLSSKADLCAKFYIFPRYPVLMNLWFADEEFEASGRMLLNGSAAHYLSVEDAVTVGTIILEELEKRLTNCDEAKAVTERHAKSKRL